MCFVKFGLKFHLLVLHIILKKPWRRSRPLKKAKRKKQSKEAASSKRQTKSSCTYTFENRCFLPWLASNLSPVMLYFVKLQIPLCLDPIFDIYWFKIIKNKSFLFYHETVYFIVYTSSNSRQLQWNFVFNDLILQNTANCEQNKQINSLTAGLKCLRFPLPSAARNPPNNHPWKRFASVQNINKIFRERAHKLWPTWQIRHENVASAK